MSTKKVALSKNSYYAVASGRMVGIYTTWEECLSQVSGYAGARYQRFYTMAEAVAYLNGDTCVNEEGSITHTHIMNYFGSTTPGNKTVAIDSRKDIKTVKMSATTAGNKGGRHGGYNPSSAYIPDYTLYIKAVFPTSKSVSVGIGVGIGIYFGENDLRNKSIPVVDSQIQSIFPEMQLQNTISGGMMDLLSAYMLFPYIEADASAHAHIVVVTDSLYLLRCLSTFGERCYSEGWREDIQHKELVKAIYTTYVKYPNIRFTKISANAGEKDMYSIGMQHAERLAWNASVAK